jgi:hypothetical protein
MLLRTCPMSEARVYPGISVTARVHTLAFFAEECHGLQWCGRGLVATYRGAFMQQRAQLQSAYEAVCLMDLCAHLLET